jgi:hypothetical protein
MMEIKINRSKRDNWKQFPYEVSMLAKDVNDKYVFSIIPLDQEPDEEMMALLRNVFEARLRRHNDSA